MVLHALLGDLLFNAIIDKLVPAEYDGGAFVSLLDNDPRLRVLETHCGDARAAAGLLPSPAVAEYTCVDFSAGMLAAARANLGERAAVVSATSCSLPFDDGADAFDAVLDKGTLDAIGIHSRADLAAAVAELARVVTPGGVVVSVSRALEPEVLTAAFDPERWAEERDGGLHITEGGEVSTDLAASLYAWRRRGA